MKRLACSICLLGFLMSASWAGINAVNGFYVGGDLADALYDRVSGSAFTVLPLSDVYVRPYIGYRFSDYLAVESGYNNIVHESFAGDGNLGPDHYRLYAIDLEGKLIYPFKVGFSIFGKLGLAYAHQSVFNQTYWNYGTPSADTDANRILPLVGVGVSYNFTLHFAADLSATYLQGIQPIGSIGILGLGLVYTF